jgi:hypothetical protein
MVATFAAVGIFRQPLLLVVCVAAPVSVALAFWLAPSETEEKP